MSAIDSTSKADELSYLCACGERPRAGLWAAAHWNDTLTHQCDSCGRQNTICGGMVTRSSKLPMQKGETR